MANIRFQDHSYPCENGATVLETLLKAGYRIPFFCRAGLCQSCLLHAREGNPTLKAQQGLTQEEQAQGYFLACQCTPETDLTIELPKAYQTIPAVISELHRLNPTLLEVTLTPLRPLKQHPGQYITLWRDSELARAYTLASATQTSFWVQRLVAGEMSQWLFEEANTGDKVTISLPRGHCYYPQETPSAPIVIISTGVGIGAAIALANTAQDHPEGVNLYVWCRSDEERQYSHYCQVAPSVNLTTISEPSAETVIDHLEPALSDQTASLFYLLGPAPSLLPILTHCQKAGVKPAMIKSELFPMPDDSNTFTDEDFEL